MSHTNKQTYTHTHRYFDQFHLFVAKQCLYTKPLISIRNEKFVLKSQWIPYTFNNKDE